VLGSDARAGAQQLGQIGAAVELHARAVGDGSDELRIDDL
jgi:hypothetical protein